MDLAKAIFCMLSGAFDQGLGYYLVRELDYTLTFIFMKIMPSNQVNEYKLHLLPLVP